MIRAEITSLKGEIEQGADVILPKDPALRKRHPLYSGVLKYFPRALLKVAHLSVIGGEQHAPGKPLHWVKGVSEDHLDCLMRHLAEHSAGIEKDTDGQLQLTKIAWRALAELETVLKEEGHGKEQIFKTD